VPARGVWSQLGFACCGIGRLYLAQKCIEAAKRMEPVSLLCRKLTLVNARHMLAESE